MNISVFTYHFSHQSRKLLAALFLLLALLLTPASYGDEGKIIGIQHFTTPDWFKDSFLDIQEDAIEASEDGKHLMLFFHLEDCPYCAKMLSDSFAAGTENETVIRENFDSVEINIRGAREVTYHGDTMSEKAFSRAVVVQYTPTLLFFDAEGQAVLTLSGYRSPAALARALRYVKDGAYRRLSLTEYAQQDKTAAAHYKLRPHPDFHANSDLSATDGALMLIIEDDSCDSCAWIHENILHQPDVRALLQQLTVVRLDAKSAEVIKTPAGKSESMAEFIRRIDLPYRPGIIFYEDGKEIFRVTGQLNHYHLREAIRYVTIGHRSAYPRFGAYLRARRDELLSQGETIDYSF